MSVLKYFKAKKNCVLCRFTRSLTFSAIGAWIGYAVSTHFGAPQLDAVIYSFFTALALVLLTTDKQPPRRRKRHL
ncbi:MAG: hypothetical protein HN790_02645 [Methylococcales bacterium]|jgi:uncharacterized membrane protein YfcA|nr:hypothetical protein [Methylococcales bacterium]